MQEKLEQFINHLNREVVAVLPNVRPAFRFMGAAARVGFLPVVEKTR